MMSKFQILDRSVGLGQSPYFIAQLNPATLRDASLALKTLDAAADAGAEAIELLAPSMIDSHVASRIIQRAGALRLAVIATHFSDADLRSAIAPRASVHGLAYPALVLQGLVSRVASSRLPLFFSTEACELAEIEAAYAEARAVGARQIAILHHVGGEAGLSANLHTILDMSFRFDTAVGLTDQSKGATVAVAAVALGATIVAKPFSLDPETARRGALDTVSFSELVANGRAAWQALGLITYGLSDAEKATRAKRGDDSNLLAG